MKVWGGCLKENLETEVRSRIIGCRTRMMSFKFFFGINSSFTIYSIADNLLKTLQAETISAVESQKTAKLSLETLERMRSQENSDAFFDTVKSKAEKIDFMEESSLPRKKQAPNYRKLEQHFDVQGLTSKSVVYPPSHARENFRLIYFEVLDSIMSVTKERFNQPSFQAYMKMEYFLLKAIDSSCSKNEHDFLHENYRGDIEVDHLEAEKEVWKTIFCVSKTTCSRDIHKTIKALTSSKKLMIPTFNLS